MTYNIPPRPPKRFPLMHAYNYILDGHTPIPADDMGLVAWSLWFADIRNRRVVYTELSDRVHISTVFLGTDHSWGEGPPILFESMIFVDGNGGQMDRYCTWDEAMAGHNALVVHAQQIVQQLVPRLQSPEDTSP
jgi:hypothetical protein